MNNRLVFVALAFALILVAAVVAPYIWLFGAHPLLARDAWGQFGDYFAGLLNPLFSMLAFLALLYSITMQRHETQLAAERFAAQHKIAQRELAEYANERITSELLAVVRDIDLRLDRILGSIISKPGTHPEVTVAMMISEADRLRRHGGESQSHDQFVVYAKEQGSVVEALVRDMTSLVEQMREILTQFSAYRGTSQAPLIVYYANKVYGMLTLLEDAGTLPPYTRATFATVSDEHH